MFNNRAFQVKMVKEANAPSVAPTPDFETMFVQTSVFARTVGKEATKVIAATLILNAGCKIAINRLSK